LTAVVGSVSNPASSILEITIVKEAAMPADAEETAIAPRATRRDWVGLAVLGLPCLLYSMDLTVLNLAVPTITADLDATSAELLWIVDIYGFLVAGSLITMGTLGDRIGRRKLLMIGAAAFAVASIFAAFATSAPMLIVARALLGVAAATLAPSTLSLIRNMFLDPKQRGLAIGIWIACFATGGAIGPLIGGAMLAWFWWGSVFLIAVPVMAVLLVLAPILLPEFRDPDAGRLDLASAALSLVSVLAVIYGMKQVAVGGALGPALAIILAGLVVGALFVRRQRRLADPLIDLALFRKPAFSASLGINVLGLFAAFGMFVFIAQYFQLVLGMSPLEAGLWSLPSSVALIVGSIVAPMLASYVRPGYAIAAGFVVSAVGFLILTQLGGPNSLAVLLAGSLVFSIGLAPIGALTTDLVVGSAPPERAGAASAISETSFEFGGALGIAVLGSLFTAVYRTTMDGVVPADLAAPAVDAAHDTLGRAAAAAEALGGPAGANLLATAREAFTHSLTITAATCSVLAVAAAMLAATLLRDMGAEARGEAG
jgi:DHA2 family multidrug resistance protein-like MFS transporter